MYNEDRSYIYNKAYYEAFIAEPAVEDNQVMYLMTYVAGPLTKVYMIRAMLELSI